ncbi:MAG TPA: RluA family pseudouridine synthase, partial [candidate division Zixibacteria bacterium]|nr:RluA family pseudouridine synthase [candidate division Zixibacteria bacterium]
MKPTRLDTYLVTSGLGLSRNQIQKLIRDKNIEIPGKGVKPAFILYGGEEIIVRIPEKEPLRLKPEDIPLDIPYEDEHLLVVNKPPGMVVHPARGHFTGTLVHALLSHTSDLSAIGGQTRPGIIHRLDRETSGLLIVAK